MLKNLGEDNFSKQIVVRNFSGQRAAAYKPVEDVDDQEAQAALRQMSMERLMAYGVHHADAVELRARVWSSEVWQAVATELAQTCIAPAEYHVAPGSQATRANRLFRASALLRMSQMMMVDNGAERSEIFRRAGRLYEDAAALVGDRKRRVFDTPGGPVVGWFYPSKVDRIVGRVVVIGGIEGWAMDFGEMGSELAARGMDVVTLDGPGQGESRMLHGHYLRPGWEAAYAAVFDTLKADAPNLPLGFVGNSMGGAVAFHLARHDHRIAAVCDNGGGPIPGRDRSDRPTFARKMAAHVGAVSNEDSMAVWRTVAPVDLDRPLTCPVLVVHGALDPVVSDSDAHAMFESAVSEDKRFVIYSDGDHCVYNHADDKHALIADWMASRLAAV
jgi:alpha-beta hydrolase superfamily lysophospholipase